MATPKKALLIEYELDWVESKLKEFSQLEKEIPSKKYIRIIDGDKHRDNKYYCYSNNYNKDFFITNKKIYKKDLYRDRIIEDFKKGDTIAGIARRYNLGETTCSRIIKGN